MSSISANQHYFIIGSPTPGVAAYNRPRIVRCPSSLTVTGDKSTLDFDSPQDPNDVVTFGPFEAIDATTIAQCSVMTSKPMTFRGLYSEWALKMLTNDDYKITSIYSYQYKAFICQLPEYSEQYGDMDLRGADMVGDEENNDENISYYDFSYANFKNVEFRQLRNALYAKFIKADLSNVTMRISGVDFSGADFSGALVKNVTFNNADLRGANFDGADLTGTDLSGTTLDGAELAGATLWGIHTNITGRPASVPTNYEVVDDSSNSGKFKLYTDPDVDGDGIENEYDNAPNHFNPNQEDANANGIWDNLE